MAINPIAGTSQLTAALTALGTTAFGGTETDLYKQLLVAVSAGGVEPDWTPADIADLAIFFWFKPGVGSCFSDMAGTTPAAAGDDVKNVTALYGAQVTDATEATNFPTLQSDGLQLDAAGAELLNFSSQFTATDITVYWSMIAASSSNWGPFASDTVQGSFIGYSGGGGGFGNVGIYDNAGEPFNGSMDNDVVVMGRFNTSAAGNYSMIATSMPSPDTGSFTNGGFDFNQIGGMGAVGPGNDSTANRFRLLIAIKRSIALDSAEDLLIRDWITTNDGASL